jgi:hypothetical protein
MRVEKAAAERSAIKEACIEEAHLGTDEDTEEPSCVGVGTHERVWAPRRSRRTRCLIVERVLRRR